MSRIFHNFFVEIHFGVPCLADWPCSAAYVINETTLFSFFNVFAHHGWSGRVVLNSKLFQMAFGKRSRSRASALKKEMFNNLSVESGTIIF